MLVIPLLTTTLFFTPKFTQDEVELKYTLKINSSIFLKARSYTKVDFNKETNTEYKMYVDLDF